MNLLGLWAEISSTRIELSEDGRDVVLEGDASIFTPDLVSSLQDHKPSLLALLESRPPKLSGAPYDDEPMPCNSKWPNCTYGDVRSGLAQTLAFLGFNHRQIAVFVRSKTGYYSPWALDYGGLAAVDAAIDALVDPTPADWNPKPEHYGFLHPIEGELSCRVCEQALSDVPIGTTRCGRCRWFDLEPENPATRLEGSND